jgi:uncharacterized protein YecT (DUF1311 family)
MAMAYGVGVLSLLLPPVVLAAAGALPVETVKLKEHSKTCTYKIAYPRTGQARIDAELGAWIEGEKGRCDPRDGQMVTTWTPKVRRNDDQVFAVSFDEEIESEVVKDTHERVTFNFLRPDGWRVYLPEIFEPAGLAKISQLAIAALKKDMGEDPFQVDMMTGGAGPDWDNFAVFVLRPKTLDIYFSSNRVGAYASGPQEIRLPLDKLAPYYRKDWRAPAPSFNCQKAATPVERTICGDVALARLDRTLHELYVARIRYDKPAAKEEVRKTQHAWLQQRDATCGSTPAAGIVGCLDGLYQKRLAELKRFADAALNLP